MACTTEKLRLIFGDVTLDLNGSDITGAIATTGVLNIENGANVTITDSSDDEKGTISNSGSEQPRAVCVQPGGNLTLDGGINLSEETNASSYSAALFIFTNNENAPKITIRDANLTAFYSLFGHGIFYNCLSQGLL